jgi:hypothetical protein
MSWWLWVIVIIILVLLVNAILITLWAKYIAKRLDIRRY